MSIFATNFGLSYATHISYLRRKSTFSLIPRKSKVLKSIVLKSKRPLKSEEQLRAQSQCKKKRNSTVNTISSQLLIDVMDASDLGISAKWPHYPLSGIPL